MNKTVVTRFERGKDHSCLKSASRMNACDTKPLVVYVLCPLSFSSGSKKNSHLISQSKKIHCLCWTVFVDRSTSWCLYYIGLMWTSQTARRVLRYLSVRPWCTLSEKRFCETATVFFLFVFFLNRRTAKLLRVHFQFTLKLAWLIFFQLLVCHGHISRK